MAINDRHTFLGIVFYERDGEGQLEFGNFHLYKKQINDLEGESWWLQSPAGHLKEKLELAAPTLGLLEDLCRYQMSLPGTQLGFFLHETLDRLPAPIRGERVF